MNLLCRLIPPLARWRRRREAFKELKARSLAFASPLNRDLITLHMREAKNHGRRDF